MLNCSFSVQNDQGANKFLIAIILAHYDKFTEFFYGNWCISSIEGRVGKMPAFMSKVHAGGIYRYLLVFTGVYWNLLAFTDIAGFLLLFLVLAQN